MPKVSVIIPTHNRPELLKRAVSSVLAQTYHDFELIIVDDCVEKRSENIVRSFSDPRIIYVQNDTNLGASGTRTKGIKMARGEYICTVDDDDMWASNKLALQVEALDTAPPDIGFCFTATKNIYQDKTEYINEVPEGIGNYFDLELENTHVILGITLMIKKKVYEEVNYWDPTFPSNQEVDLLLKITKKYRGIGINKPLAFVSLSSDYEHIGSSYDRRIKGRRMILERYKEDFQAKPKILGFHEFQLGLWHRNSGKYNDARTYFLRAFKHGKKIRYLLHAFSMIGRGVFYKLFRKPEKKYISTK